MRMNKEDAPLGASSYLDRVTAQRIIGPRNSAEPPCSPGHTIERFDQLSSLRYRESGRWT